MNINSTITWMSTHNQSTMNNEGNITTPCVTQASSKSVSSISMDSNREDLFFFAKSTGDVQTKLAFHNELDETSINEEIEVLTQDEENKYKEQQQKKKKTKYDDNKNFAMSCSKDDLEYCAEKKKLISIGKRNINTWTLDMLKCFLRVKCDVIVKKNINKEETKKLLVAFHLGKNVRKEIDDIKTKKTTKKKSKSTKPDVVTKDGTLYRAINAIVHPLARKYYIDTGRTLTRNELDSKNGHKENWEKILDFYNKEDDDFMNCLGKGGDFDYVYTLHGVEDNVSNNYDKGLTVDDFISIVEYVNFHYRQALNKNEKSGTHDQFPNYVDGKIWLVYYFASLQEIGDTHLSNMAMPKLHKNVLMTPGKTGSGFGINVMKRSNSNISSSTSSICDKKSVMSVKKQALESSVKRNNEISTFILKSNKMKATSRLQTLIEDKRKLERNITECKNEIVTKRDSIDACPQEIQELKKDKKSWKLQLKFVLEEYNTLKNELNYNSEIDESSDDDMTE